MISFFPVRIASGIPLATAFEKHAKSALIPKYSCAPPNATLNPVHISSKTRTVPFSMQISLSFCRKLSFGSSKTNGSRITQAVSSSIESITDCISL